MKPIIVQRLKSEVENPLQKAKKYYSVLLALNHIYLSSLELNLLAFIAVKGTISTGGAKEQFCTMFNTTKASIANTVHKLNRKGFLIKINDRTRVVDRLQLDFNKDILLNIKIEQHEGAN